MYRTHPTLPSLLLALLIAGHMLLFAHYYERAYSEPDAHGYYAQAVAIADTGSAAIVAQSPVQYVGMHWMPSTTEPDTYYCKYPPGFPLLLAGVDMAFGPAAMLWVSPVLMAITLALVFLVARRWVGDWWALLTVALLVVNPVVNEQAMNGFAHVPVVCCLVASIYAALRWTDHRKPAWAAASGLLAGLIVGARYPEVIFVPGVAVWLWMHLRKSPRAERWKHLGVYAAAAALPILAIAVRNQIAFGAFWRTAYLQAGDQTNFALHYFFEHATPYLRGLLQTGVGFAFPLGVIGIVVMFAQRDTRPRGATFAALIVPITMLYMAYYWLMGDTGGTMRFMLPVVPLYTIAAAWLLRELTRSHPRGVGVAVAVTMLALTTVWGLPQALESLGRMKQTNRQLAELTELLRQHVPAGSVVVVSPQLAQSLDGLGEWRVADASTLTGERGRGPGGMMGGPPQQMDRRRPDVDNERPRNGPMPGGNTARSERYRNLDEDERIAQFTDDVFAWADASGVDVYWLDDDDTISRLYDQMPQTDTLRDVADVTLTAPPQRMSRRGPGGPGGPGGGPGSPGVFGRPDEQSNEPTHYALVAWTREAATPSLSLATH